jgi:hypothetical protein
MKRLVALSRSASYSPNQHRANDLAILQAVTSRLTQDGWSVTTRSEREVEGAELPRGDLYLNMCQGRAASIALLERADSLGGPIINHPSAVLNCHRTNLTRLLGGSGLPFPRTEIVPADPAAIPRALAALEATSDLLWVKRGDVHAEVSEDVVAARAEDLPLVLERFRARGIAKVALQNHAVGPIVKFYGVSGEGTSFFHWYRAEPDQHPDCPIDEDCLREVAFSAAALVGLEVFGGDAAVAHPNQPVLIDLNDWPSFAPVRHRAAAAIAGRALDLYSKERFSWSTSRLTA